MQFSTEKHGYNKKEVDEYLRKVSREIEVLTQEQTSVVSALKKEIATINEELSKYKEQDESISDALVAAVETAKQIEENSKHIYELEISRIRSLYDKWQGYLDEMMDRYPEMREHFDPSTITAAFKKSIDEVLSKNSDELSKNSGVGIRNLISKMNGVQRVEAQKNYTMNEAQKHVKRKPRPSLEAVQKKLVRDSVDGEKNRVKSLKINPILEQKGDNYNSLAEQFLNEEIGGGLEDTAYSKSILKKKKESGFDLKEALTPTEDLMDIMKAFDIDND